MRKAEPMRLLVAFGALSQVGGEAFFAGRTVLRSAPRPRESAGHGDALTPFGMLPSGSLIPQKQMR